MRVVSSNGLATRLFAIAASLPAGTPAWQNITFVGSLRRARGRTPPHAHLHRQSGSATCPWRGSFYPEKCRRRRCSRVLRRAAPRRCRDQQHVLPDARARHAGASWAGETPDGFQFAIKSPRRITHEKKLGDVADSLTRLREATGVLGERLGPAFPSSSRPSMEEADAWALAGVRRAAAARRCGPPCEFRHRVVFSPDVYDALRARRRPLPRRVGRPGDS